MNKVALILFSNSDFGGAERRLVRIYNELGKENECDIIVRGSDYDGFYKRLKKADCDVSNIHKIITFKSNFLCLLYLIICRKYKAIHFFDMCGFNIAIAKIMRIFSTRTLLTVAFQNYAFQDSAFAREFNHRKPAFDHWMTFSIGSSSCNMALLQLHKRQALAVEFYIGNDKELFHSLYEHRMEIEAESGLKLDWRELPHRKASRILIEKKFELANNSQWNTQFEWAVDVMLRMKKAFKKHI